MLHTLTQLTICSLSLFSEHLQVPDLESKCLIKMPSAEFQRICKDLAVIGDTVAINASKDGVKFSVTGDLGTGNITIKKPDGESVDKEKVGE